jgi:tetratricopeptide (TPR) repeat protein
VGIELAELGRREEAVAAYDDVVVRFGAAPEGALREAVARALVYKAIDLAELGRREEAIQIYDDVIVLLGTASQAALRELFANALFNKAIDLGALGRREEAVAVYGDIAVRFGSGDDPDRRRFAQDAFWQKGNILFDELGDLEGAELAYREALKIPPRSTMASGDFAWLLLTTLRAAEARTLRTKLDNLPFVGLALLDAGIELAGDNFGSAVEHLGKALEGALNQAEADFFDDLLRFLRLAEARGYGERLIAWFEATANADKYAPVHAAFVAYVRGERLLLDVSPEVRRPARDIFNRLTAQRIRSSRDVQITKPKSRRRPVRKHGEPH